MPMDVAQAFVDTCGEPGLLNRIQLDTAPCSPGAGSPRPGSPKRSLEATKENPAMQSAKRLMASIMRNPLYLPSDAAAAASTKLSVATSGRGSAVRSLAERHPSAGHRLGRALSSSAACRSAAAAAGSKRTAGQARRDAKVQAWGGVLRAWHQCWHSVVAAQLKVAREQEELLEGREAAAFCLSAVSGSLADLHSLAPTSLDLTMLGEHLGTRTLSSEGMSARAAQDPHSRLAECLLAQLVGAQVGQQSG